jgi:hypothetical protein
MKIKTKEVVVCEKIRVYEFKYKNKEDNMRENMATINFLIREILNSENSEYNSLDELIDNIRCNYSHYVGIEEVKESE